MKLLRGLGWTMIWAGGLVLLFLVYQLWGTNLITDRAQDQATDALEVYLTDTGEELAAAGELPPPTPDAPEAAAPVLYQEPSPALHTPFARIVIPKAGVDHIVFEGVSRDDLKKGPGHMEWTALPGQPGNAVISGHRTTYGAPFYDLDLVEVGDDISVQTAIGTHVFAVREILIVSPSAVEVTEPRLGVWLTLTTCHPRRSAAQRLIVHAELVAGPNLEYARSLFPDVEGSAS